MSLKNTYLAAYEAVGEACRGDLSSVPRGWRWLVSQAIADEMQREEQKWHMWGLAGRPRPPTPVEKLLLWCIPLEVDDRLADGEMYLVRKFEHEPNKLTDEDEREHTDA